MTRHLHNDGRFGFDAPRTQPIERSITWAARHGFRYIDFQADVPPNDIASFDAARVREVRALCERHEVALGIHPSSAINNAEYVPIMAAAVDDYLAANLDLAVRLGCGWIIGHGGYHFGDLDARRGVAIARMQRLLDGAERNGVTVYFENHNREPEHAEMHYLPHTVEETRWFFDAIESPHFKWAFNVAHGNLVADGWHGIPGGVRRRQHRPGAAQRQSRRLRGAPGTRRGQHRLRGAVRGAARGRLRGLVQSRLRRRGRQDQGQGMVYRPAVTGGAGGG